MLAFPNDKLEGTIVSDFVFKIKFSACAVKIIAMIIIVSYFSASTVEASCYSIRTNEVSTIM